MESKAYKKVKDLTPLEIQIKVLEDIGVKDRIEIRLLKEQLRLCGVLKPLKDKEKEHFEYYLKYNFVIDGDKYLDRHDNEVYSLEKIVKEYNLKYD